MGRSERIINTILNLPVLPEYFAANKMPSIERGAVMSE